MFSNKNVVKQILIDNNIKPSYIRIYILSYLMNHGKHSGVEEIYNSLHDELPTLSKTSVYNSLNLFINSGFVTALNIKDSEVVYEYASHDHGHFICEKCDEIFDFEIDANKTYDSNSLNNFKINSKAIYFRGICPNCQ